MSHPPASEVMGVWKRSIFEDRPGVTDRYRVMLPVPGELLDAGNHLCGSQRGPGWKFPRFVLPGSEDLHVGAAYIDNEHMHDESSPCLTGLHQGGALGSDDMQQFVPGIDERPGPFVLKLGSQGLNIDAGPGELREHGLTVATVGRQQSADVAVLGEGFQS